jgi:hypothetical protein
MSEATLLGLIGGIAYFQISEAGIPKNSNCSYLAPVSTDILAFLGGVILQRKGIKNDLKLVEFIGTTVTIIHIQQYLKHKQ